MTATALADRDLVVAATCEWCGDRLSSPYLRRPDGLGLHVACAQDYVRTAPAGPAPRPDR